MSQNKFARVADLDRTTIASAEHGKDISELTVYKIANALSEVLGASVDPEHLMRQDNGDAN